MDNLQRAIETALWFLDPSVESPNGACSAGCMSTVGGEDCLKPLMRAISALKETGLPAVRQGTLPDSEQKSAVQAALWHLDGDRAIEACRTGQSDCELLVERAVEVLRATGLTARPSEPIVH